MFLFQVCSTPQVQFLVSLLNLYPVNKQDDWLVFLFVPVLYIIHAALHCLKQVKQMSLSAASVSISISVCTGSPRDRWSVLISVYKVPQRQVIDVYRVPRDRWSLCTGSLCTGSPKTTDLLVVCPWLGYLLCVHDLDICYVTGGLCILVWWISSKMLHFLGHVWVIVHSMLYTFLFIEQFVPVCSSTCCLFL